MGKTLYGLRRLLDAGLDRLVALESISPGKDIYYSTLRCHTLPSKEAATSSVVFATDSSRAVLSFPPRGVTGTSGYRFEYDLHLIKIPSHLDRESVLQCSKRYQAYVAILIHKMSR